MIGTTGRALIAAPGGDGRRTPQIEMPEASGAAHSRLNLKNFRAIEVDQRPVDQVGLDDGAVHGT